MPAPTRGLYELLITESLERDLAALASPHSAERKELHRAEAADRIALHLARVIERALAAQSDKDRVRIATALARDVIDLVVERTHASALAPERPVEPGAVLRAIRAALPDGRPEEIPAPQIPLLDSTLLTNAPGEPRVGRQIETEIHSADRIDVVMAFIRRTGIEPLLDALRRHTDAGRSLRVLTTVYTGSTEASALDALKSLGADVRVSYDETTTRLHAKAWLFHRASGFSTAYIGSSNLTHSAQVTGLEWNVRASKARNAAIVDKVAAVFESYWQSGDFVPYEREAFVERVHESRRERRDAYLSPIELRAEPFQERMLEQLALARLAGRHKNLLVAATGTGKTVMAVLDYQRLREGRSRALSPTQTSKALSPTGTSKALSPTGRGLGEGALPRARLLFVAHREEILTQALRLFRHALRDGAFGELWVGGRRPDRFEHVFASIQSLDSAGYDALDPQHFDVVIIDEFHHSTARSYQRLLDHVRPVELLGLTATPERSDGESVLDLFEGRIAAELRVWDAIDRHFLSPFLYYGVHDDVDLTRVPWRRGRGYDVDGLTNVLTADDAWARKVFAELQRRVDDVREIRALGFCVSVEHARFMARVFNDQLRVPSVAVWADTPEDERRAALRDLRDKNLNVVFSVDLFNEGVDVPAVDTLLMLRPTDSPTLFLQQLGRGLRKASGKSACTVLDFVGRHRSEFRFDRRLGALLGGTRKQIREQVEAGFPFLPAGCHMELDAVARETVLANIQAAVPSRWDEKADELRRFAASRGGDVTLREFLAETDLGLDDLYDGKRCWSALRETAGLPVLAKGPAEESLRRGLGRLLHVDDRVRIDTWRSLLTTDAPPAAPSPRERGEGRGEGREVSARESPSPRERGEGRGEGPASTDARSRRLLRMLVAMLADKSLTKTDTLDDAVRLVWQHPQVLAELRELLDVLADRITHVPTALTGRDEVPLVVHARYTRIEILAAFGIGEGGKVAPWQTGVYWAERAKCDLLAFTLDKTSGQFSPTTRYRDYAISTDLVHWESQSVTREDGETGRRYREHAKLGTAVMLFARHRADDRAFHFLGPATYVKHEGELPMAVTWRLQHGLPGDLFVSFAAAVA